MEPNRFSARLRGIGRPPQPATPGWLRELAELAAIFVTVGAAHLLANLLGHQQHGPILLIALGVGLVASAAIIRGALRRRARRHTQPPAHNAASTVRRWLRHAVHRPPWLIRVGEATALWRIRTTVDDAPGSLAVLAENLGHLNVNILAVELHPLGHAVTDELIVETSHRVTASDLVAAIQTGHGAGTWVGPADAHDLTDLPTRILGLAARAVTDPGELPEVLHDLYRGSTVSWSPEPDGDPALAGTTIRLEDPRGGQLTLTRPELPFSPAELARARALVDIAAITISSGRTH